MRFPYHDLNDGDFERLVVAICAEVLGDGVQPFSSGPDGGRDARFHGRALRMPSEADPHTGKFVVQAKHTEHPAAKFSDPDFSGPSKTSTLTEELDRVKRLVAEGELEVYYLFSNRRLAGEADATIRRRIKEEAGVAVVELFGIERVDLLLKRYPAIERVADLKAFSAPLLVTSDDLAEIIVALDNDKSLFADAAEPTSIDELRRSSFERKNVINGLTEDFASEIVKTYLPHFDQVKRFLANPINARILERYRDAASEFHEQLLAHRGEYDTFDQTLLRMQNLLFARDPDLSRRKRGTKLVLYYMYWNCDIGKSES